MHWKLDVQELGYILCSWHYRYVIGIVAKISFRAGKTSKRFWLINYVNPTFPSFQARSTSAISTRESSVSALKNCWEILKSENISFVTLVTGAFPPAKAQDNLLHELRLVQSQFYCWYMVQDNIYGITPLTKLLLLENLGLTDFSTCLSITLWRSTGDVFCVTIRTEHQISYRYELRVI